MTAFYPIYDIDEIGDDTTPLIVHFSFNYVDEFDIDNYVLMTKEEYLNYLSLCRKFLVNVGYLEIYFGTNEFITFTHLSNFKAHCFYYIKYLDHIEIIKPYFELIANTNIINDIMENIKED